MKKILSMMLLLFFWFSCTEKQKSVELAKGTPDYELAKALSEKLPYLHPDENNIWISCKEFDLRTGDVLQSMREIYGNRINLVKKFSAGRLKRTFAETAQELGVKKLILNKAVAAGIRVRRTEVDSLLQGIMGASGGEEKYRETLRNSGQSIDDVRKDLENRLFAERYLNKTLAGKSKVTEADVLEAYRTDKHAEIRQILLTTSGKPDSVKQKVHEKMTEIMRQAKNGADFAELVRKYSDDKAARDNGGLFRIARGEERAKAIQDAAFSLPIGEVSDIIKTEFGLHIIKVVDRYPEKRPLAVVRQELEYQISSRKSAQAYQELIEELKREGKFRVMEF